MKGYRRFVAYVYEYRRGQKEENCGYIRVEARDDNCTMEIHLKCPGLPGQVQGEIYGFVRKQEQIEGYLLHQCLTLQDGLECSFETNTEHLGEHAISLMDLGGMVIRTEGGAFFGTEWDDRPIRPDGFCIHSDDVPENANNNDPNESTTTADCNDPNESTTTANNNDPNQSTATANNNDLNQSTATVNSNESANDTQDTETFSGPPAGNNTLSSAEHSEAPQDTAPLSSPGAELTAAESTGTDEIPEEPLPPLPSASATAVEEISASLNTAGEIPESAEPTERHSAKSSPEKAEIQEASQLSHAQTYERADTFDPFPDGSIRECRKISAEDFSRLHPRDRGLRNNRFVSFSYQQFGYLLVGQLLNGQYILGLPGGYDQQERFMAGTFGFPYFKDSPEIRLPKGRGGYWYRLINAPDLH